MTEHDLDLEIDLDDDDPEPSHTGPTLAVPLGAEGRAAGGGKELFIFEPEGDATWHTLSDMGLRGIRATLGSDIMAAAQEGRLAGVLISPAVDTELRELFVRALRGRLGNVPVVYFSTDSQNPEASALMRAQGASAVCAWPPEPAQLASLVRQLMDVSSSAPVPAAASSADELKLLTRKLEKIDSSRMGAQATPAEVPAVPRPVFEQAVRDVAERSAENTSLRSELTLFRERARLLEDRVGRLNNDLSALAYERDELRARLVDSPTVPQLNPELQEKLESIKKVGDSVESFLWGLEQAIQFLEELQFEAGDQRAPSLAGHLRSLKLVRVLLERLRERTRGI